jgi:hypothetical protein
MHLSFTENHGRKIPEPQPGGPTARSFSLYFK